MELIQSFSERAMVTAIVWGRLGSGEEAKERVWVAEGFPTQPAWIREWDPGSWTETRSWKAHEDTILDMDLNSQGTLLATASADRLAKLWELGGAEEVGTKSVTTPNSRNMEAHAGQVWAIAFHPTGESIVTGSGDQEVKVWDVAAAAPTQSIQRILSGVTGVGWLDEGKEIFAICEDGAPRICRPDRDRPDRKLSRYGEGLRALAVSPDGKRWFGAGLDSVIYEWDTRGRLKNEMKSAEVTE
jgi:WD40 repeat protein